MHEERPWYEWPDEYKFGDPSRLIEILSPEHGGRIEELAKDQYYFYVQWKELKEYCNGLGISLMGDLPMRMDRTGAIRCMTGISLKKTVMTGGSGD